MPGIIFRTCGNPAEGSAALSALAENRILPSLPFSALADTKNHIPQESNVLRNVIRANARKLTHIATAL
jgi:hypothetical protein